MSRYNCWMDNGLKIEFIMSIYRWPPTGINDLQPVGIEHAHLSVLNRSYLSASPHTLAKQLLQIESWESQCYDAGLKTKENLSKRTKGWVWKRNAVKGGGNLTSRSTLSVSSLVNINNRWARRTWSSLTKRSFESYMLTRVLMTSLGLFVRNAKT